MSNVGRNLPRMSNEDIQAVDHALNDLRGALRLPPRDVGRQNAAISLRRSGFTTPQIVTLSHWPRQSVDRWVEGAAMPAAGAPAERAIEILADAVNRNLTLDHLIAGLNVQTQLIAAGTTVEQLLEVQKQLQAEGILLSDFIEHLRLMREAGLGFADVKRHLDYKKALESVGFSLDSLRLIHQAAEKLGTPDSVLAAIDTYESLKALTDALAVLRKSNESEETRRTTLNSEVTNLESKQSTLQNSINENQNTIQQLKRSTELGYNLESLRNLQERTRTLGGLDNVLTAIARYETLLKLEESVSKAQASIDKLNADRTKLKADNAQYETEIDTTRKLINEHKLGLQAIQELLQLCIKYGAPEEVFRAIRAFDNLKTLESNVAAQQSKLAELTEKEKQLTEKLDMHLPEVKKMLLDIQTAFKADVNATRTELKADLDQVIKAVSEASQAHQEFVMRAADNAPYMELLQLTKDPNSVTTFRILSTITLILKKLEEWIPVNQMV